MEPEQVLNYQINKKLGLGGHITLYAANEIENPDNKVVVSIFDEMIAGNQLIGDKFVQEMPTIMSLNHKNIVKTINFERKPEYLATVTEMIPGQNLQFIVLIKGLSKAAILEIFSYILKAVESAHKQNILHLNLKPSNIIVGDRFNDLKVIDFLLAKILLLDNPEFINKFTFESPMFLSPEMVTGKPYDLRTDIYSLGVLLYFMLSHKTPYLKTAPNSVIVQNIINDPIPEIKGYTTINEIIKRATAKNPDERYQSCAEFLAEIDKA